MTTPDRILKLISEQGPMTRRQIADELGIVIQSLSTAILTLIKTKELVQHHRCRQPRIYALPNQFDARSVADEIQHAKRYKAGDMLLIDAKLADKAVEALRGI